MPDEVSRRVHKSSASVFQRQPHCLERQLSQLWATPVTRGASLQRQLWAVVTDGPFLPLAERSARRGAARHSRHSLQMHDLTKGLGPDRGQTRPWISDLRRCSMPSHLRHVYCCTAARITNPVVRYCWMYSSKQAANFPTNAVR